jgi:hypothetical protein
VEFSDGVDGTVLLLEPGAYVVRRDDGLSYTACQDPDGTVTISWHDPGEPFAMVREMVRFICCKDNRGTRATPEEADEARETIRAALDFQSDETRIMPDAHGRAQLWISLGGCFRVAVALDGMDWRDPYQQESVFAEADKVLRELTA